jgi:DNA polymerase III epsilon subunit family exonuclease
MSALASATFAVVDVETTGIDPARDRVVEVACVLVRNRQIVHAFSSLVNPGCAIRASAFAVHGIDDAMVANAPTLAGIVTDLQALCTEAVVVAHNASFDLAFLPFLNTRPHLCSMRLAQRVVPDAPSYKNQVLRHHLAVDIADARDITPHRALGDVHVTAAILRVCLDRYLTAGGADDVDALLESIAAPVLLRTMPFGKHRGRALADVPSDYLQWTLHNFSDLSRDTAFSFHNELDRRMGTH